MKNILLSGAEGFVGKHLSTYLGQPTDVLLNYPGHHTLDQTNSQQVAGYLNWYQPDIIIHSGNVEYRWR